MPAPVVHFEIGCRNVESTRRFYSELLGWEYSSGAPNMAMISNLGSFAPKPSEGIGGHITALGHEPHHYVTVYAQVADIPTTLAKAEKLGGRTLVPKTEVPGMGHFAWFGDPDGNVIGLWTPMAR